MLISFSSAPICLNILYFFLSSIQSDNSFKASIAEEDIKNMIPKYKPMNVIIAVNPAALISISYLVSFIRVSSV